MPMLNTINTDTKYDQYRSCFCCCVSIWFQKTYFAIMQHFSDCDGSAIFGTETIAMWNNSYQHPMRFDLFQTSSKWGLTWVGVHVLRVLSTIIQKSCLINCINSSGNCWIASASRLCSPRSSGTLTVEGLCSIVERVVLLAFDMVEKLKNMANTYIKDGHIYKNTVKQYEKHGQRIRKHDQPS
jgi:hypothetical protein